MHINTNIVKKGSHEIYGLLMIKIKNFHYTFQYNMFIYSKLPSY